MSKLKFYRIEAGVIDYDLTPAKVQEVLEKAFGFVIHTRLHEVNPFDIAPMKKPAKPAGEAKPTKAKPRKATSRRSSNHRVSPNVRQRIETIKKALGNRGMTLKELHDKTNMEMAQLAHALVVAEETRTINVSMRPNPGTRAVRVFKNA